MSTTAPTVATTTTPVVVPVTSKTSWLKRIGSIIGKIAKVFVNEMSTAEPQLVKVAETMFPQFAPAIAAGDAILTKITKQIVVTESVAASVTNPPTGESKLQAVTAAIGPELDQWIQNLFPGSTQIAAAEKAGLVQAVVNIVNKQPGTVILPVAA